MVLSSIILPLGLAIDASLNTLNNQPSFLRYDDSAILAMRSGFPLLVRSVFSPDFFFPLYRILRHISMIQRKTPDS